MNPSFAPIEDVKKNRENAKKNNEIEIRNIGLLVIGLGLLFFSIEIILELCNICKIIKINLFWETLKIILNKVAETAIVFGVGTIILEYGGFTKYAAERLKEVVVEHTYLKTLNDDEKRNIINDINKTLYPQKVVLDENSLFNVVHNSIEKLLDDYYLEEDITDVNLIIDGKFIKKEIRKHYELSNLKEDCIIGPLLTIRYNKEHYSEAQKPFELIMCTIKSNNEYLELPDEDKYVIKLEKCDDNRSVVEITFDFSAITFKKEAEIDLQYITLVPIEDRTYTAKIRKPCKRYCIHLNYDIEQCSVLYSGFCFMDIAVSNKKEIRTSGNNITIRFKDWSLPGEGTAFYIIPKESSKVT